MTRLRTIFNEGVFTRPRTAVAALGCLGILLGAVAVAPQRANAQGTRYALTVHNQSR